MPRVSSGAELLFLSNLALNASVRGKFYLCALEGAGK